MGPMLVWSTQFITKTESDHKFDHVKKSIASRMDHTKQLLHPLRNAIKVVKKGVSPIQQDVRDLQRFMQQLQQINCLSNLSISDTQESNRVTLEHLKWQQQDQNAKIEQQQIDIQNLQH